MVKIPEISRVNLVEILRFIGLEDLRWSILYLWATSKQGSAIDIIDLEKRTKDRFGYQLDWDSLLALANELEQVIECTLVGVNHANSLPDRTLSLDELKKRCHVVIEAVDSTSWEVYVKDEALSRGLMEAFGGTQI